MSATINRIFVGGCLLSCFLFSVAAYGQLTQATLKGTISDISDSVVTASEITARNDGTGEARSVKSDASGNFVMSGMNPGAYTLKVNATGFRQMEQRNLILNVGRTTEINVKLEVASLQTDVQVIETAAKVAVSTEARLSDTFTKAEMSLLPLSRDIYALPKLSAGATAIPGAASSTKLNNSPVVTVNGNRYRGNNYVLDGALNVNPNNTGEPTIVPTTESLQEAQVQTSNFSSEYGRGNGSVVNLSTKSGSNELHGRIWEYNRNAAFNARNFFSVIKAPQIYNQFGANAGGKIIANKTFFFGSYEGTRNIQGQALTFQVETPEYRNYVINANPNSVAAQVFKKYPAPTPQAGTTTKYAGETDITTPTGVIPQIGRAAITLNNASHYDQYLIRLDHSMRDGKDHLSGRWIAEKQGDQGATSNTLATLGQAMRGERGPFTGSFGNLNLGEMHLFGKMVNDARFSTQLVNTAKGDPNAIIPSLAITGITAPFGDIVFNRTILRSYEVRDSVTFELGKHTLRVGGEWRRIFKALSLGNPSPGTYNFTSLANFAADTPFKQTVNVDPSTGRPTALPRYFHQFEYALFIQDDWKVTRRLNVNLGLRQDYFGPVAEAHGLLASIIFGPGNNFAERLATASVGRVTTPYNVKALNLSPRVGIAWDPFGDGKSSIRAGFSMAYAPHHEQSIAGARPNPPDVLAESLQPNAGIGTQILYGIPVPFNPQFIRALNPQGGYLSKPGDTTTLRLAPWVVNPDIKTQYSESWFLNIQRQVLKDWTLELGYVGTNGVNLERIDDINRKKGDLLDGKLDRINPNFDTMLFVTNGIVSHYNAFTAEIRHSFSKSLSFQANYRWSKWLDNGSDTSDGQFADNSAPGRGAQDIACTRCEYGKSLFDIPKRLSTAVLWNVKPLTGNRFLKALTRDWQTSMIATIQSGRPFTVWCGTAPANIVAGVNRGCDFNLDGGGGAVGPPQGGYYDRPDAPLATLPATYDRAAFINGLFNADIFPRPALGQDGNLGRNTFRGLRYIGFDASIGRTFPLVRERVTLQIRAEAFNFFNNVNLYLPNTDLSLALNSTTGNFSNTSIFGKSTQAFDPRNMQLSARITF